MLVTLDRRRTIYKIIDIHLDLLFIYDSLTLMMKLSAILVSFVMFPSLLMAQTPEQARRIEEEKREALRPTETQAVKEKKTSPPPLDPLDLIYFAELMLKKVAFRYDACKALVLLTKVENQYIDLGSQIIFLRGKKILPKRCEKEFDPM